ncbi:MAG: VOC family protein [Litorimonas sp.]
MSLKTIIQGHRVPARLEHININVVDPKKTADRLCRMFGWSIRWEGPSINQGTSVHVGTKDDYVALYSNREVRRAEPADKKAAASLNHIAVVVDDLGLIERRVVAEGLIPTSFADYHPGHRFYFDDFDGVEYEVVSYAADQPSFWEQARQMLSTMS